MSLTYPRRPYGSILVKLSRQNCRTEKGRVLNPGAPLLPLELSLGPNCNENLLISEYFGAEMEPFPEGANLRQSVLP